MSGSHTKCPPKSCHTGKQYHIFRLTHGTTIVQWGRCIPDITAPLTMNRGSSSSAPVFELPRCCSMKNKPCLSTSLSKTGRACKGAKTKAWSSLGHLAHADVIRRQGHTRSALVIVCKYAAVKTRSKMAQKEGLHGERRREFLHIGPQIVEILVR